MLFGAIFGYERLQPQPRRAKASEDGGDVLNSLKLRDDHTAPKVIVRTAGLVLGLSHWLVPYGRAQIALFLIASELVS